MTKRHPWDFPARSLSTALRLPSDCPGGCVLNNPGTGTSHTEPRNTLFPDLVRRSTATQDTDLHTDLVLVRFQVLVPLRLAVGRSQVH